MADARVYLFNEAGSYLGWYAYTDATGKAGFVLPVGNYKVRVDKEGNQYWSTDIAISAGATTALELDLNN